MITRAVLGRIALLIALAVGATSCTHVHILFIAQDGTNGRDQGTPGSASAQNYIIGYLRNFAPALDGTTDADAYRSDVSGGGTNIVAMLPGADPALADEIVVVGAHYDGTGSNCSTNDPADTICNGAADNAASVGIVLEIARALADDPPRRSVIFALWDREEDGLIGSREWVEDPSSPIDDVVAYLNFDITGSNLLPSLSDVSFAVGSESGGPELQALVDSAVATQPLGTLRFGAAFGQGRSDYVNFLNAQIPTVFFTDSTGPCYDTAQDEYDVIDIDKLQQQTEIGLELTTSLANADEVPVFTPGNAVTFDDAVVVLEILDRAVASDLDLFRPGDQGRALTFQRELSDIVADGPDGFVDLNVIITLLAASTLLSYISSLECDGFLD